MNRSILSLVLVLLLAACAPTAAAPAATATSFPPTPSPLPPTLTPAGVDLAAIENGTYSLAAWDNLPVTLVDGKFKLSDPAKNLNVSGQIIEPVVFGDLNGDGLPDAAVIIATNTGGTGTFHELFAVLAQKGPAASLMLGDRIKENQLTIKGGTISLDYLRTGPNDGLCCPSEHALTTFEYKNNSLQKVSDQVLP